MKALTDTYKMNDGWGIPCLGFGTWQAPDGDVARHVVKKALELGYRHIDTAYAYDNEESVGQGIRDSGVPREEIFLTTKVVNTMHGYENTLECCERSLKNLGVDSLDLYLIHWPNPKMYRDDFERYNAETWRAMEELQAAGKVKSIGVSNYRVHHLEALYKVAKVAPAVNQIRLYPGFDQPEVVEWCRAHDIVVEAYSPFGTGKLLAAPELAAMAEKYGRSVTQICLRWSLQKGFLPLPKSVHDEYIAQNADVFDFELADEDVAVLTSMPNYCGPGNDPDTADF